MSPRVSADRSFVFVVSDPLRVTAVQDGHQQPVVFVCPARETREPAREVVLEEGVAPVGFSFEVLGPRARRTLAASLTHCLRCC